MPWYRRWIGAGSVMERGVAVSREPTFHTARKLLFLAFLTGLLTQTASHAFAQTSDASAGSAPAADAVDDGLSTPAGHEVSSGLGGYTYREPGEHAISIDGVKFVGEYAGTVPLNTRRHWFVQGHLRGTLGTATYTGWCSPFVLTPDNASPNGYVLDIGDASPCSEDGDRDWYA